MEWPNRASDPPNNAITKLAGSMSEIAIYRQLTEKDTAIIYHFAPTACAVGFILAPLRAGLSKPHFPQARNGAQGPRSNLEQVDGETNAGMYRVVQEISTVHVVDVNVVGVVPARWPGLVVSEPVTTVLESWRSLDNHRVADYENVLTAEVGMEIGFGDAATTFVPCLLFVMLFLFFALLCLLLLMLGYFFLLRLFLFVLRGFFLLRFLLFRLGVFLFCLGRFGFLFLLIFLLVVLLLGVERSGDSEDRGQSRCGNHSDLTFLFSRANASHPPGGVALILIVGSFRVESCRAGGYAAAHG